ncbi:MAG: N-sulfoglucosamine sulfohydrolase, partial [Mariniblastus sp.]
MLAPANIVHSLIVFVSLSSIIHGQSSESKLRETAAAVRPNILFAISDDQSWEHTSAYGCQSVSTPNFDRVAREGVLFNNSFCASPGCSPSRASILTGRYPWQLEHAGTHASHFHSKYAVYPDLLENNGYFVG